MEVKELDFELPTRLLATHPRELEGEGRDASRMLVMHRKTGQIEHRHFSDLVDYLEAGDLLVLNDSRTVNANLFGNVSGLGRLELQLRSYRGQGVWHVHCRPWREPVVGATIDFGSDGLSAVVEGRRRDIPLWIIKFADAEKLEEALKKAGRPIISPYVDRVYDNEYYNTIYAQVPGSAEMPAAGRHFTQALFEKLAAAGVRRCAITLHTGLSSIEISSDTVEEHSMYEEWYSVPETVTRMIAETRAAGHRVVVVGTTVMRCLESSADDDGNVKPGEQWTTLYIFPGYRFKVSDVFITNFHGPRTTRLALAAAFAGKDLVLRAYREAIEREYLFYEFGDTTLTI